MTKYPDGYKKAKLGHSKVAVSFPTPLFLDIVRMAKAEDKGFSEMVVELCKVGKLDLEESDALEPLPKE